MPKKFKSTGDRIELGLYGTPPPPEGTLKQIGWWFWRLIRLQPHMQILNRDRSIYLNRWWLIPHNPLCNIFLHVYHGGDEQHLGFHDHPWASIAFLLRGGLAEMLRIGKYEVRRVVGRDPAGIKSEVARVQRVVYRARDCVHYIERVIPKTTTLFITGRRKKEWGFLQ